MVRLLYIYLFIFISGLYPLSAQSAYIDAYIIDNRGLVDRPIKGTVTITHNKKDTIDLSTFQLEGKKLPINLSEEVPMSSQGDTIFSIFNFELPSKSAGNYILPSVTVNIGGKQYKSLPSSYTILDSNLIKLTPVPTVTISKIETPEMIFKLEALVEGPPHLYPGQRSKLIYRISYNKNVDLTYSDFPLIHNTDFIKIGDVQIKDHQNHDITYQEIIQEIEAIKPGSFSYGPSVIEGYAYVVEGTGEKIYYKNLLHTEAPTINVVVDAFPLENQPASFNGAIGTTLNAQLKMLSPPSIEIGDDIELKLTVAGPINLSDLEMPDIICQPGFSGFFQINDLPPIAQQKGSNKTFTIELKPISTFVENVPSIEISAFDPSKTNYIIWRSNPIPINITNSEYEKSISMGNQNAFLPNSSQIAEIVKKDNMDEMSIPDFVNPVLNRENLYSSWIFTYKILFFIPLGALLLLLQWNLQKQWAGKSPMKPQENSSELLSKALKEDNAIPPFERFKLIEKAIWLRLNQLETRSPETKEKALKLISDLDALQYGPRKEFDLNQILQRAKLLFDEIG
ncbi:MAG: BatD family protein [Parachlamydiaceae bacterium]|nr:BatD family protein [Parachlamydiaceae bacterium]